MVRDVLRTSEAETMRFQLVFSTIHSLTKMCLTQLNFDQKLPTQLQVSHNSSNHFIARQKTEIQIHSKLKEP